MARRLLVPVTAATMVDSSGERSLEVEERGSLRYAHRETPDLIEKYKGTKSKCSGMGGIWRDLGKILSDSLIDVLPNHSVPQEDHAKVLPNKCREYYCWILLSVGNSTVKNSLIQWGQCQKSLVF